MPDNDRSDLTSSYEALVDGTGAVDLRREVVLVSGSDAAGYLQGQMSQDVEGLAVGASTWSWILQPHGKVDALVRVTRQSEEGFVLDADRGASRHLVERLKRFLVRLKVEVAPVEWSAVGFRGPGSKERAAQLTGVTADATWAGIEGADVLGSDVRIPDGVTRCNYESYEVLRIQQGVPELGHEFDERTIPTELGINDRTVSFTKGCYTGQELVARIDARGNNVPRLLRGMVIDSSVPPLPGDQVHSSYPAKSNVKAFGIVTSASWSPAFDAVVALAMVRRDVKIPVEAWVHTDEGGFACRIVDLPLDEPGS